MRRRWTAVIPSDSQENLDRCLRALKGAHPDLEAADILVVSRRLKEPSPERFTFVPDPVEKFNFARRVNLGFKAAGDRDVVLMGDDVDVATPGAFDLMSEEAPFRILSAAIYGRVGPWWQRVGQNVAEVPFVSFICVYIPRAVYGMVGPLDESFPGYGYEDTDYCIRARRKGLSIGVCGRAVVEHGIKGRSAFVEMYNVSLPHMEAEAKAAFLKKYGGGD